MHVLCFRNAKVCDLIVADSVGVVSAQVSHNVSIYSTLHPVTPPPRPTNHPAPATMAAQREVTAVVVGRGIFGCRVMNTVGVPLFITYISPGNSLPHPTLLAQQYLRLPVGYPCCSPSLLYFCLVLIRTGGLLPMKAEVVYLRDSTFILTTNMYNVAIIIFKRVSRNCGSISQNSKHKILKCFCFDHDQTPSSQNLLQNNTHILCFTEHQINSEKLSMFIIFTRSCYILK